MSEIPITPIESLDIDPDKLKQQISQLGYLEGRLDNLKNQVRATNNPQERQQLKIRIENLEKKITVYQFEILVHHTLLGIYQSD